MGVNFELFYFPPQSDGVVVDRKHPLDLLLKKKFLRQAEVEVEGRLTLNLLLSVIAALCGMFTFGYNTGVINSPKDVSNSLFFCNK